MSRKSLQISLAGTALALPVLTGCTSFQSESVSQRHWVEVTAAMPADLPPEIPHRSIRLGAGDAYGMMVYEHYLALSDYDDQPEDVRIVNVPTTDATE